MADQRRRTSKPRAISAHEVQAASEGVALPGEVVGGGLKVALRVKDSRGVQDVIGEYRMAERIGLMPLLKFAHVSAKGIDSADMEGLAAMYAMVRDAIDAEEWPRFERDAIESKAEADEIFAVVQQVVEALAARPTGSPPGSSAGRRPTSGNSKRSSPPTGTGPDDGLVSVDSLLDR